MVQHKKSPKSLGTPTSVRQKQRTLERIALMLQMKTHVGHKPLRKYGNRLWYPEMTKAFLGIRDGVTVINPEVTLKSTVEGLYFAALILRNKGRLLLVDSRHDFSPFSHIAMKSPDVLSKAMSVAGSRWIGGTLTNWSTISPHVSQFGYITSMFRTLVNQFRVTSPRYKKMKESFPGFLKVSGIGHLQHLQGENKAYLKFRQRPDLLIVCQPNENSLLLREAFRLQIPVLAFVDSNTSLDYITHPIFVNTDNHEWMYYALDLLARLTASMGTSK
jgi:small subunit ribosomal protein S2